MAAPHSSATSIRSAAASPRPGTSSSAAATPSSWRASSARPPTSSSRTTSARARGPSSGAYAARCDDFEVHFASKAFPCTAVLRILREEGLACDVASGGELAIALKAGFDPARIHLHGNAKSEAELAEARGRGRRPRRRRQPHRHRPSRARSCPTARRSASSCAWRPGISPDTHPSISTGGPNTKFGFGLQSAPAAIERLDASDRLELEGLHLHIGSQIYDVESFRTALEAMAGLASHGMVNLGGGLGVAYVNSEHPPTIEEYVAAKVDAVRDVMGPGVRILDEPGRALVANSTVTLYTVQSIKRNVDLYVAVDGGMSDNLRPMLYGARYEAQVASRFGGGTLLPSRRASTASRATSSSATPSSPTRGSATSSSLRPPAPTASPCRTPTTASRARRSSSSRTATRAWPSAARPTRTWWRGTSSDV